MPDRAKRGRNRGLDADGSTRLPDYVYLDRIGKALGLIATRELEQSEQIGFLSAMGLTLQEISEMLVMNYDAVRMVLQRKKQASLKRKPAKR